MFLVFVSGVAKVGKRRRTIRLGDQAIDLLIHFLLSGRFWMLMMVNEEETAAVPLVNVGVGVK